MTGIYTALALLVLTLSSTTYASYYYDDYFDDDFNWYYNHLGEWDVHYGCRVPRVPGLRVVGCSFETDDVWGGDYGCCLHYRNDTGIREVWLTCALDGNECLFGGHYITGNKTEGTYSPFWTTGEESWTFNGSTIGIDEPNHSGVHTAIIIGSVLGGLLLLAGAVICICKCTTCCRKMRDDDIVSLVSRDDFTPYNPPKPAMRKVKKGNSNPVYMDARCTEHLSTPTGLPSYEELEKEDSQKGMYRV